MRFLLLAALVVTTAAHARKPAVEDFVGIEPEAQDATPAGTQVLFDFGKDVEKRMAGKPAETVTVVKTAPAAPSTPVTQPWPMGVWLGALMALALPFAAWASIHARMRAEIPTPDNVTPLPTRKKASEDYKKAS